MTDPKVIIVRRRKFEYDRLPDRDLKARHIEMLETILKTRALRKCRKAHHQYKGVYFDPRRGCYKAQVIHQNFNHYCGYHNTAKDAVIARNNMIIRKGLPNRIQDL